MDLGRPTAKASRLGKEKKNKEKKVLWGWVDSMEKGGRDEVPKKKREKKRRACTR